MLSNERTPHYGRRPSEGQGNPQTARPFVHQDALKNAEIKIERKSFTISLKENPRGRFLRITEDNGGKRNSIIIPITGLTDFSRILGEMVKAAEVGSSPYDREVTRKAAKIQNERKVLTISLRDNPRGRFLQITEGADGKRNTIMIPNTGLIGFSRIVGEMVKAAETLPTPAKAPAPAEDSDSFGNR